VAGRSGEPGVSLLERAFRMLRALPDDGAPIPIPDLARTAGLPLSTTHRLVAELAALGAVERTPAGVAMGLGLWELGERSAVLRRLREAALPELIELYESTGENVHLAVLAGHEVLYVAKANGKRAIPTLSEVGQRHPLHTTGVGRAILLTRSPEWLDEYLQHPLEAETRHTITDAARLRDVIAAEAAKGWAFTRQEMTLGNISIAMPLRERPGLPPAAIGIVAHASSADEVRLLPLLRRAAAAIEHRLDATPAPTGG
jgi:DNA-binding IclR family transcriptional regulator